MNPRKFALPTLGIGIFLAGYLISEPVEGAGSAGTNQNFLAELHLHGSISEGRASMWHHSEGANVAAVDYDVLWWTDHIGRALSALFPQSIDFNNGEFWVETDFGIQRIISNNRDTTKASIRGGADPYARFTHTNPTPSEWTAGGGILISSGQVHRISLMADPEIRMDLRLPTVTAPDDVNVVVRVTLSSRRGDGVNDIGAPNIIEYTNFGMNLPTLDNGPFHNTVQIPKFDVVGTGFTSIVLRPLADSENHFYEKGDQTIYTIEIMGAGRNGEVVAIDVDNFELSVDSSRSNKNLFVETEQLVKSGNPPYSNLTQHIGMELAGPQKQDIMTISGRDHILALYRDTFENSVSALYDFSSPHLLRNWPKTGVDLIHDDNGVAILAHMFGPKIPPGSVPSDVINQLAERVLENRAWGADGIEIGYELRGAPLDTFLKIWDQLSENRVYITGVGVSDHHNVKDWNLRINRMATWIQAPSDGSADLANAIQSGHAFFGDPYQFDSATGSLDFRISGTTATMGDIFPVSIGESLRFRVEIDGAQSGDDLVWIHNGLVIDRHHLTSASKTAYKQLTLNPGDWVRIEMRTPSGEIYLMSNPIYAVGHSDFIPRHRSY